MTDHFNLASAISDISSYIPIFYVYFHIFTYFNSLIVHIFHKAAIIKSARVQHFSSKQEVLISSTDSKYRFPVVFEHLTMFHTVKKGLVDCLV